MASTYSTSLKLTLIGDGDQSGIWGQTTNSNLGTLLEEAITGVGNITMSDANYTLTSFNGVFDEARNAVLLVTGANSAIRDVIPPVVEKLYTVVNNTTGGFAIRVIGTTGTGVSIPNGYTALIYCNGTNFYQAISSGATSLATSNFVVQQLGSTLAFQYNGANIAALTSSGNFGSISTLDTLTVNSTTSNTTTLNATTVNATTANATTVTIGGFNITESGGVLQFKYGSTVVMSMDSTGNLTSAADVTAFGTP
jgi:hypothetical protein